MFVLNPNQLIMQKFQGIDNYIDYLKLIIQIQNNDLQKDYLKSEQSIVN